jgi:MFS family permease
MISSARSRVMAVAAVVSTVMAPYLALAAPAAAGEDIRDIRGPIAIPPWWRWPLAIALAALAAFAVILLVRWWKARKARALTPLQRAQRALTEAEELAREGRSREWADVVAETLRSALAARLGVDVLPQTTGELSEGSWAKSPVAKEIDAVNILALLETCDLARFAKAFLESKALLAETAIARELVEKLFAPPPRASAKTQLEPQTVPS